MIKAALFDLDGVVLDTESQYTRFWRSVFSRYYPDQPGLEQGIKGMTLVNIYARYFGDNAERKARIARELDDFEHHMDYPYIPGFEKFITALRARGVKTAVVTSSNHAKMEIVKDRRPELYQYFDRVLTSEDFDKSKPDPDAYLKGAQAFDVSVDHCAGFEDSINGLKAVRASGMFCVGLATTNSRERVAELADVVIDDYIGLDMSIFEAIS